MTQEEENKVPTAAEFYSSFVVKYKSDGKTLDLMTQFAKLHVQAALEAASEKATQNYSEENVLGEYYTINKDSILNAYPLENVK